MSIVYTTENIANVLRSVAVASGPEVQRDKAVGEAIGRTLVAVGVAFGLELVGQRGQNQGQLEGVAGLLWAEGPKE